MINKAKTKEIWKGIKQLVCLKSKGSTLPGILTINEQEITNSMIKPLLINWINSSPQLKKKTWSQLYQNQIYHFIFIKISPRRLVSSSHLPIQLRLRNENDIIVSLSSAKACSPFSISSFLLKTFLLKTFLWL